MLNRTGAKVKRVHHTKLWPSTAYHNTAWWMRAEGYFSSRKADFSSQSKHS